MTTCPFCSETLNPKVNASGSVQLYGCPSCYNPMLVQWEGQAVTARPLERSTDVRVLAPPESIGAAVLEALPQAVERLPVLPEISQRVLGMVSDPDVSMADIAAIIREDQTIAMSIMKLANSPVYGGLDEIKELNAACARLGMRNIANTVQIVANKNLYITGDARLKSFMRKLWRHSIATAHCAGEVAGMLAEPRAEMLFLAGLVQNIGKVVLLDIITGQYTGAIGKLRVMPEVLREIIENFHPLLGLHVLQHWGMPSEFLASTYFQTHPGDCPREDWLSIVHIIALSSHIANVEGFGLYEVEDKYISSTTSARYLALNDVKLAGLRVDIQDRLEALFELVPADA